MDNRIDKQGTQQDQEIVEFDAEMPQVQNDDVEFVPDEKLEEEITESEEI